MPHAAGKICEWTRDGFIISTDQTLLDLPSINKAFASDSLYWASPLPEDDLKYMIQNSVCFGLYSPTAQALPESNHVNEFVDHVGATMHPDQDHDGANEHGDQSVTTMHPDPDPSAPAHSTVMEDRDTADTDSKPAMIGFARIVTDFVTVAYLTDVYVLPDWQGQGLGVWLNECVKDWFDRVPSMRRILLISAQGRKEGLYKRIFGARRLEDEGLEHSFLTARGRGNAEF